MNTHLRGLLITALGVLFVVPDSLFVRLIAAEPMVTAFWRGLTSGTVVLIAILLIPRLGTVRSIRQTGWSGVIYIALIGTTTAAFVLAISNTSVANAVFIFATLPVFAAIFSWLFLGESIGWRMVITMAFVAVGLAIIAYGSGETETAHWTGDLWALYVSVAYAAALTAVRKVRNIPMIPTIPVAYIGSALVILIFVDPWQALAGNWPLILAHGGFIGVATCFLTLGPRYIRSAEVSLLILLESVLAPLLVWAVIDENPGRWALIGGAVVIGALVISNLVALRRGRA